jgi:hypothetical protein
VSAPSEDRSGAGGDLPSTLSLIPHAAPRKEPVHPAIPRTLLADFETDGDEAYASLNWTIRSSLRWEIVDLPGGRQQRRQVPKRIWIEDASGRELRGMESVLRAAIGHVPALAAYMDELEWRIADATAEEVR